MADGLTNTLVEVMETVGEVTESVGEGTERVGEVTEEVDGVTETVVRVMETVAGRSGEFHGVTTVINGIFKAVFVLSETAGKLSETVAKLSETVGEEANPFGLVTEMTGEDFKALVWVVSVSGLPCKVVLAINVVGANVVSNGFVVTVGCKVGIDMEPKMITQTKLSTFSLYSTE